MAGMNINVLRSTVVQGQIATVKEQIKAWEIYASRTGESVTDIVAELNKQITLLTSML